MCISCLQFSQFLLACASRMHLEMGVRLNPPLNPSPINGCHEATYTVLRKLVVSLSKLMQNVLIQEIAEVLPHCMNHWLQNHSVHKNNTTVIFCHHTVLCKLVVSLSNAKMQKCLYRHHKCSSTHNLQSTVSSSIVPRVSVVWSPVAGLLQSPVSIDPQCEHTFLFYCGFPNTEVIK